MKKLCLGLMAFGMAALVTQVRCSSSDGAPAPAPQVTAVMGKVVDGAGTALAGVAVTGGGATATSDAKGMFQLDAKAGAGTIVRFTKDGYVGTQKLVDVQDGSATALKVAMLEEAPAQQLDASAGGTVSSTSGAELTAAAGAFVDKAGQAVTGSVDVHLTPFDPSVPAQRDALPTLRADTGGGQGELESFGVLDITVRQSGEKLAIKGGSKVTVRIPVAAGATDPPATIPLWSFDESSGRWKQEGTATLTGAVYEGEIAHMSLWNCDQVMDTTCIRGVIKVESGAVLPGGFASGVGVDYSGFSEATSDDKGVFCMAVRKSSKVRVTVTHPEGGGVSREVQSGSTPSPVPPVCANCTDVGEWVVKQGSFTGTGGQTVDCKTVKNPLAGGCADGFWGFSQCFQPSGACKYSMGGSTTWANGSRVDVVGSQQFEYYGPGDKKCGTATISVLSNDSSEIAITVADTGETFKILNSADGGMTLGCPNGQTETLSAEQVDAMRACTGSNADQETCEVEGIPGSCTGTGQGSCAAGQTCCDYGSNVMVCVPDGYCQPSG